MTSKAQRRQRKKQRNTSQNAPQSATKAAALPKDRKTARPTPERLTRGVWAKQEQGLMLDKASDMIGRLQTERQLTAQQVEAARAFQELRAAYVAEIGAQGYRSCLAGGVGGYDGGDGNAQVMREYAAMRDRIGRVCIAVLEVNCDRLADEKPTDLAALRNALDVLGRG